MTGVSHSNNLPVKVWISCREKQIYPGICLKGLTKNARYQSGWSALDLNWAPPKCK
jgi:hypothetical protein